MGTRTASYQTYLKSDHWVKTRDRVRAQRKLCEACRSTNRLEVHHRTYARVGRELDADLHLLCHACHQAVHDRRALKRCTLAQATDHVLGVAWKTPAPAPKTRKKPKRDAAAKYLAKHGRVDVGPKPETTFIPTRSRLDRKQRRAQMVDGIPVVVIPKKRKKKT